MRRIGWLWTGAIAVFLAWVGAIAVLTAYLPPDQQWRAQLGGFVGGLVIGHYVARVEVCLERKGPA